MASSFSAQVDAWTKKSEARLLAVFKEASQRTFSIAQSLVPIDTGFCRASFSASLESMPPIDPKADKPASGSFAYDPSEVTLTIASAKIGDVLFAGYGANYSIFLERGSSKQAPSGFVRLAALQWQHTVDQVAEEAKARVS